MIHHLHTHLQLLKMFSKKHIEEGKGRSCRGEEQDWEEIETFITLWEGNEVLYNVSLSDYLNKDKKSAAVKQIAKQLETNEENVSKKMASLSLMTVS